MTDVLKAILPVVILLLIGMIIRKNGIISDEGISGLQSVVMNVTLPTALFGNFYKTQLSAEELIFPATMFIAVVAGLYIGKLICKKMKVSGNITPYMLSGYEAGMLGFAFMNILTGDITKFAILDIGQDLAIFTVYITALKNEVGEKQEITDAIKNMLKTPVLVGILAGLIIGVTGIGGVIASSDAGEIIDTICDFISAPTSAIILIVIGYRMNLANCNIPKAISVCGVRAVLQLVFAVIILTVYRLIGGNLNEELVKLSVILMFILPPPFILPLYTTDEEQKEFLSSAISLYTLLTILLFFVLIIYFFQN